MCHSKDTSGLEEKGKKKKKFTSDVEDLFRQKKKRSEIRQSGCFIHTDS